VEGGSFGILGGGEERSNESSTKESERVWKAPKQYYLKTVVVDRKLLEDTRDRQTW